MSHDFTEEDDLVVPRRVDWRLWRRILGHLKPYPKAVAMMIGGGSILAGVEVMLPLVTARIIDAASGEAGTAAQIPWWGGLYFAMLVVFALLVFLFIRAAGTLATGVASPTCAVALATGVASATCAVAFATGVASPVCVVALATGVASATCVVALVSASFHGSS